jgi:CheY-like chemotaxis protein
MELFAAIFALLFTALAVVFLIARLRFFSEEHPDGRYPIVTGAVLLLAAVGWQIVKATPGYGDWFITPAYAYLNLAQQGILALGIVFILVALALYHDFWETAREDIRLRSGKLSILENLSEDAQRPYQIVELLTVALKEILLHFPGAAGSAFLVHKQRRQFVLAGTTGLNKNENALMEYYPLERNIVSQAIDLGQPMIGGDFVFVASDGKRSESRFQSTLVLPLTSGLEKLGALVLLSPEERFFSRADVRSLIPVAGWLSERVHTARLCRDLTLLRTQSDRQAAERQELNSRLLGAAQSLTAPDPVAGLCRALVGLYGSDSVHLCGIRAGSLYFHGGSKPLIDLSENLRTALQEAVDRQKPLILNQEANDDSGNPFVISSSLVYPLKSGDEAEAIVCRKEGPPFALDDRALSRIELFSHLARAALARTDIRRLDLARRVGLDKILELLSREVPREDVTEFGQYFIRQLGDVLPDHTMALSLVRAANGCLRTAGRFRVASIQAADMALQPGEGTAGQTVVSRRTAFVHGQKAVVDELASYRSENRTIFQRLFADHGYPGSIAFCPLSDSDELLGVAVFFLYDIEQQQRGEYERLLTLASMLYSIRVTVSRLQQRPPGHPAPLTPSALINRINNHLSAVVGNTELALSRDELSGETRRQLKSVLAEAEQAASLVQQTVVAEESPTPMSAPRRQPASSLLDASRVSGNIYMAGGKARELDCRLDALDTADLDRTALKSLLDAALNRFAVLSSEDEMITLSSYQQGEFIFLDISRHPRNFPPVREVASFGQYKTPQESLQARPGDAFLNQPLDRPFYYAHDRENESPTFLSFKFPVRRLASTVADPGNNHTVTILAIDDEAVILDLIAAMCQSMGYRVELARSGEEGLRRVEEQSFDLVLADLSMPGMSGLEAARRIKTLRPRTPVVLVTGWQTSLTQAELQAAGVARVLSKPFRIEQLTEIIETHAGRRLK